MIPDPENSLLIEKRAEFAALTVLNKDVRSHVFVELGVAAGDFMRQLLWINPCLVYWGIDRWSDHHNKAEFEKAKKLADQYPFATVIRSTFDEALPLFPAESITHLYIDGYAHTGQEKGKTLEDWFPKVAPGCVIGGHDYDPAWPKTLKAVDGFAARHHLKVDTIPGKYKSWYAYKV